MELQKGKIVISKAGHDKGNVFVIVDILSDREVLVMDGRRRKIQKLKKKNVSHLQYTGKEIPIEELRQEKDLDKVNASVRKQLKQLGY